MCLKCCMGHTYAGQLCIDPMSEINACPDPLFFSVTSPDQALSTLGEDGSQAPRAWEVPARAQGQKQPDSRTQSGIDIFINMLH